MIATFNLLKSPDSVAKSSWHIDVWPADSFTAGADRSPEGWIEKVRAGDYFDIPYGCIVADQIDNLLMAGRCISADHWAQSSLRIQQTCMATGQAAGLAAALSIEEHRTPRAMDPRPVAERLASLRSSVIPFQALPGFAGDVPSGNAL